MSDIGECQVCHVSCSSRCSRCRQVFYCNKTHQQQDWKDHKPQCVRKKFQIEDNERLGRHMVLTEDVQRDALILKERPLVLGPNGDAEPLKVNICLGCYKPFETKEYNITKRPCSNCSLPVCSDSCSKQYFHENFECKFIRESSHGELSASLRSDIMRNIFIIRCVLLQYENPVGWREMMSMESHCELRKEAKHLEHTTQVYAVLQRIFVTMDHPQIIMVNKSDVHKIIGLIEINATEFRVSEDVELYALFRLLRIMEHNCQPTIKYYYVPLDDLKYFVELRARASIPLKKGRHLSISYTNTLWNTEKRRDHLTRKKHFLCICDRCMDPYELDSNFSTIVCQKCKGYAVPKISKKEPELKSWQCSSHKCRHQVDTKTVKKLDLKLATIIGKTPADASGYAELLRQIDDIVHPNYYLTFAVNHALIQMYGHDPKTVNDKAVLQEKLKICNNLLNVIKLLDPGCTRLNIYAAVIYYEMHSAVLGMAGGETDDDFQILRRKQESLSIAQMYLARCIDCFQYEHLNLPEHKLKLLAQKKQEYLQVIAKNSIQSK